MEIDDMTLRGRIIARQYASDLPVFTTLAEAEVFLFAQRDATLEAFIKEWGGILGLDQSPDSLKRVERWHVESGKPEGSAVGYSYPHALGFYFGDLLCRSAGFAWLVSEYDFQPGRFEIGVRKANLSIRLTKGWRPPFSGNKRMQSLWRQYRQYIV